MDRETKLYPAYYGGVKLAHPHIPAPGAPAFSRSAVMGNLVFCSGAAGLTLDTFKVASDRLEDQMEVALDKIKMYMEEAGSSMNNIIKTVICLRDIEDYPRLRKIELAYYQKYAQLLVEEPPVTTLRQVRLDHLENRMEIDVIGVIPG